MSHCSIVNHSEKNVEEDIVFFLLHLSEDLPEIFLSYCRLLELRIFIYFNARELICVFGKGKGERERKRAREKK